MIIIDLGGDNTDGFVVLENAYPSRDQQVQFAEEYIATLDDFRERSLKPGYDRKRNTSVIPVCNVDQLLFNVDRFALASHFLWSCWSLVQHEVSKIDFAYLKYAKIRFEQYMTRKKELGY